MHDLIKREPYRLLFPCGLLLCWAGVLHWFLHSIGWIENYHSIFHAMTQIQGFLMSFAAGFLFTMIPRRTSAPPATSLELAIAVIAPIGTTISAWYGAWALSQVFWLILAITIIHFAVARFTSRKGNRPPPNSFVWIPLGFLFGVIGSVMTALGGIWGTEYWWLHSVGRRLITQGIFISLILGVGGLAIPLMTRGQAPRDAKPTTRDRLVRLSHVFAALVVFASFLLEEWYSLRAAFLIRGVVIAIVLFSSAGILNKPSAPGWNSRSIWIAAWMLPLGYLFGAIFDDYSKAALHIVFIGGFGLLTLSIAAHVVLAHGHHKKELVGRPVRLIVMSSLILAAMVFRVLMEFDRERFFVWMGFASALFLLATISWMLLLVPKLVVTDHRRAMTTT